MKDAREEGFLVATFAVFLNLMLIFVMFKAVVHIYVGKFILDNAG